MPFPRHRYCFRQISLLASTRHAVTLDSSALCGLLNSLAAFFAAIVLCFQWLAHSSTKTRGRGAILSANSASIITFAFDSDRLCFQKLTNPFPRNPFIFTSIQNPRGVGPSTLPATSHQSRITSHLSLLSCSVLRASIYETC